MCLAAAAAAAGADEVAVYLASGASAGIFDQYDNDGYSLGVSPRPDGSVELRVQVSGGPLESRAPFPTGASRDPALPVSPERDAWAIALVGDARTQALAVERILAGIASTVRYDADRGRKQDPASVFASRRAHCVGFAELAVDLLRRVGIGARTVQGVLRAKPGTEGYDSRIGGLYHRWIEIYYADRGFVFSDPSSSINGVDARYIPFGSRTLERPRGADADRARDLGPVGLPAPEAAGCDSAGASGRGQPLAVALRRSVIFAVRMAEKYAPSEIESKWQRLWAEARVAEVDTSVPGNEYYMLNMYPYPSGSRLHVGHGRNYILGDALYRRERMAGRKALNPMGWDAFGLPAENAAIQSGVPPRQYTLGNIARMKEQLNALGCLYDWSKELASCDPAYYRWNQWLFLRMWERGLAYRKTAPVNWCPGCRTVLANEQVVDGRCERSGDAVEIRDLTQWFFRVTDYAERLLEGLNDLPHWSERVKTMQRNWIGRSEGAEIQFAVDGLADPVTVFTTRPDTLHGASFLALAPEHPAVARLAAASDRSEAIAQFVDRVRRESRLEREAEGGDKEGLATGAFAINPGNGEKIPVWLANFVLPEYGTGAIMGVPAHDQRDFDFARQYGLPIRPVYRVDGEPEIDPAAMTGPLLHEGRLVHSGQWDGTPDGPEAIRAAIRWLEKRGVGKGKVGYRLRDWLISRQRYWGTPIPAIHCSGVRGRAGARRGPAGPASRGRRVPRRRG